MDKPLPWNRPPPDRRLIAASIIATPITGACLGAAFLNFPGRYGMLLPLVLVFWIVCFGLLALFTFAYSRAAAPWFVAVMFAGCGSAAAPNAIASHACDRDQASACYLVERRGEGIAIDEHGCGKGVEGSCERLFAHDFRNALTHCETWKKTCRGREQCEAAAQRCDPVVEAAVARNRARIEELTRHAEGGNSNAMNSLAWMRATSRDASVRDGGAALAWAEKALAVGPREPSYIDTLAAAYAELGRWDEAIATEERAIALLDASATRSDYEAHLALFRKHQPVRESEER